MVRQRAWAVLVNWAFACYGKDIAIDQVNFKWETVGIPFAQKDPRFLFGKRRGQPWKFWSSRLNNRW